MMINKQTLHLTIEQALTETLNTAIQAAAQARSSATDQENKAENKYDTLGLEASYLAEGQSRRVTECEENISIFNKLKAQSFGPEDEIQLGALVQLIDQDDKHKFVFLSPVAGGVCIEHDGNTIMLITLSSPLGKRLQGASEGDEVTLRQNDKKQVYEIHKLY